MELFTEQLVQDTTYEQLSASANTGTLFNPRIVGTSSLTPAGLFRTAVEGKRVEISENEIRIYDENNVLVATLSGEEFGGLGSAIDAVFGLFSAIGLRDDATGDPFSLGTGVDGAVMMDLGDVAVSARKAAGGGGSVNLIPDVGVGDKVRVYEYLHIVPRATPPAVAEQGDIYFDTDGKLYVYTGAAWVVAGTQT